SSLEKNSSIMRSLVLDIMSLHGLLRFLGLKRNALNLASKEAMEAQGAPVKDLVEMKMNQYQVLASGKVVETVDEILGTLLDKKT
ncbi:MAG: hypothetical protein KZQ70_15575, partial [gamma proteobacterium symbiont of Lucinoma myriamae]|nr:hypothetical protein [gamma proteobacterium symbiont of Lucinoma myriamae]MCU7818538.1 hypothetical protein [gamma proteobacterium symbiont of Lucinoma myriamae]MCU7832894.1 hypothetical protein [gamma proteobacterium symbiont of Lucinoma myriamae]